MLTDLLRLPPDQLASICGCFGFVAGVFFTLLAVDLGDRQIARAYAEELDRHPED